MRRLGHRHVGCGLFLQRQEAVGQRIELALRALDHLPLLGDLAGQFLDGLLLLGGADFQRRQPVVGHGHLKSSIQAIVQAAATFEIDKRAGICRE